MKEIRLEDIDVSQFNTRKDLGAGTEDTSLDDLATSIKEKGLLSPITVLQREEGKYELIAGQRRFLACKKIGLRTIPAIVRNDLSDTDATILSLVENVHRADMNPLDKARAFDSIHEKYKDYGKVARETGVTVPTIKRYLSLLNLAPSLQQKVSTSEGVAGVTALSSLANTFSPDEQEKAFNEIGNFKQTVQVEILKRSEGNFEKLLELKERALEGAFDIVTCKEGLCVRMPEELKEEIKSWLAGKESYSAFTKSVSKLQL